MSYYILPKNTNIINVNPVSSSNPYVPFISYSFLNYYLETKKQIIEMFTFDSDLSDNTFEDAIKIINPHEFIFSKVPGSKFSVSKLKPNTNLFYDLYEIITNLSFFDNFKSRSIHSLHVSSNFNDSVECYEMLREGYDDTVIKCNNIEIDNELPENNFEYIFFETVSFTEKDYCISLVKIVITILKSQKYDGNVIIKMKGILHKPILDCIYLLTSLYDKVYIVKPHTNNITSLDRYIVCKSFQCNELSRKYLKLNALKLIILLKKLEDKNIIDILGYDLPYYFKNKIDDLNIIIGQQQIESLDQIIAIFKNKNKNDKIESIKKTNIQKSVSWCEKYKIPCNKFKEKINIFLPIINETI